MPRFYAAMKMQMGSWDYYTVKMDMASVASEISFATDVNQDKTLDAQIQRDVGITRAKKQIVKFLAQNNDRFFSSIVVAALDGNPQFTAVQIADDPRFSIFANTLEDTFGMLTFDDTIKTYALDGQHRLYAIKQLIDNQHEMRPPAGFSQETISVIFVVPREDDDGESFRKSYRALFSALNRHAKPTSKVTNIIMDEIDRYSKVTRRMVSDFEFFQWTDEESSPLIDTKSNSESITGTDNPALFTLVGLYKMNTQLLWDDETIADFGAYTTNNEIVQEAISDESFEDLYEYLERIWDSLLLTLPVLASDPTKMRVLNAEPNSDLQNNLLFRPIGHVNILAPLARRLMSQPQHAITRHSESADIQKALEPLSLLPWNLMHDLWRNFYVIQGPEGSWTMVNESRAQREKCAHNILAWVTGIEDLTDDHLDELKQEWSSFLGGTESEDREVVFDELEELRSQILEL